MPISAVLFRLVVVRDVVAHRLFHRVPDTGWCRLHVRVSRIPLHSFLHFRFTCLAEFKQRPFEVPIWSWLIARVLLDVSVSSPSYTRRLHVPFSRIRYTRAFCVFRFFQCQFQASYIRCSHGCRQDLSRLPRPYRVCPFFRRGFQKSGILRGGSVL